MFGQSTEQDGVNIMESGKGHTRRGMGQHKALKPDGVCSLEEQEAGVRGARSQRHWEEKN